MAFDTLDPEGMAQAVALREPRPYDNVGVDCVLQEGFQAANVDAIRSERVICAVKIGDRRFKAFQVFFGRDGSLFINFPYFRHRTGLLSSSVIPANGAVQSEVNLERGGKVTSHLIKYSHHSDGRAHFSQDGRIFTAIKRQSVALKTQHGRICSLVIQGLSGLDLADPVKDVGTARKRSVIDFEVEPAEAVKFVGWWYDVSNMRFSAPTPTIGPVVPLRDPDGLSRLGCLVASPYANARHVLALTCQRIPKLGPAPEVFIFYGGFDPEEAMRNPMMEAGFLAFQYPVPDAQNLQQRIGTVDYRPRS